MNPIFRRTDILLPQSCDLTAWSVVACDQFTSRPDYWDALDRACGDAPSALRLILPEAYLAARDPAAEAERIRSNMERYLAEGVFRTLRDSYVYVWRTLPSGAVRRGLVGAVDLEAYDYAADSRSPVRATEGTVEDRLPPRVRARERAPIELSHTMLFFDDPEGRVFAALDAMGESLPLLYDFPLSGGGGRLRGRLVTGEAADEVDALLASLLPGGAESVAYAVGDGNHSIAAAKRCWEARKRGLDMAERESDPARRTLAELVNLRDEAIVIEHIHRCLLGTDPSAFLREARQVFTERYRERDRSYVLRLVTAEEDIRMVARAASIGELIGRAERFCAAYAERWGGSLDYIHNDETALELGLRGGGAALMLPRMEKGELISSVERFGPFPKKSFSIGRAEEKRYYLEARSIQ